MLDALFELCLRLGRRHPNDLFAELSIDELLDWLAWMRAKPRGDERVDYAAALISMSSVAPWSKVDNLRVSDFLIQWNSDEDRYKKHVRESKELLAKVEGLQPVEAAKVMREMWLEKQAKQ